MSACKKCGAELPEGANYCFVCGSPTNDSSRVRDTRTVKHRSSKKRGNGQGTIKALPNGKYMLTVTLGYYTDEAGKRHRKTRSKVYARKKDAVAAVSALQNAEEKKSATFKEVFDKWLPTHRAGESTLTCYRAAIRYFEPLYGVRIADIDVDDLQDCIDACPKGKRTKLNMRTVCGLVYKYAIPRHLVPDNLNLAAFLKVDSEAHFSRASFTDVEIEKIKKACGKVPHAEDIYCMIYTGFRPSEFLALTSESYDPVRQTLVGGSKTRAGKNRTVTLSPKIASIVARRAAHGGVLFPDPKGRAWRIQDFTSEAFYPALEAIGIENPLVDAGGGTKRHRISPHTCRHTFATLMKRVAGADKDKLELIGHNSEAMLRYYQDVSLDDLRRITDAI